MAGDGGRRAALSRAFDEARFGASGTLNLRESLPTAADAAARVESWLRERQASGGGEVLVITGRGNQSAEGFSPVRERVLRKIQSLRRTGVVAGYQEHTPGSFVVTLAPLKALLESPRRSRRRAEQRPPESASIEGLDAEAVQLLRDLARCALGELGAPSVDPFLGDEMRRQYSILARRLAPGPDQDRALKAVLRQAISEYE
jgi:hypothetical protein